MKTTLQKLLMTAALAALSFAPALAATPKTESLVNGDRITLGDVFDGVTANADHYLAPAPAMGKSVTLTAIDLARISEAFSLDWKPTSSLQRVVVRRASNEIGKADIEAALQEKLMDEMDGQKFDMDLASGALAFQVEPGAAKDLKVENFLYDAVKGEFRATVYPAASPADKKEARGKIYPIVSLPVLRHPLRQGDVISADDIDYVDMRSAEIGPTVIVDAAKLAGMTPRRGIAAMKPVTAADVQAPLAVKKGDLVTMTLQNSILNLTTQGRALDSGAEGESVRVMNVSSKQIISATVAGPQTVNVKAPDSTL